MTERIPEAWAARYKQIQAPYYTTAELPVAHQQTVNLVASEIRATQPIETVQLPIPAKPDLNRTHDVLSQAQQNKGNGPDIILRMPRVRHSAIPQPVFI